MTVEIIKIARSAYVGQHDYIAKFKNIESERADTIPGALTSLSIKLQNYAIKILLHDYMEEK